MSSMLKNNATGCYRYREENGHKGRWSQICLIMGLIQVSVNFEPQTEDKLLVYCWVMRRCS